MKVYRIQNAITDEWWRGNHYAPASSDGRVYTRQSNATAAAKRAARVWAISDESVLIWAWELNDRTSKSVRTLA